MLTQSFILLLLIVGVLGLIDLVLWIADYVLS